MLKAFKTKVNTMRFIMTNLTKREIKNTFLKMLEDKPLNQITVKALVAECGINRNSFYYHYPDIPALIEEIVKEEADEIIREYASVDSMQTGLNAILAFASMKRRTLLHIFNSVNRDIFEQHLWKICEYVVGAYLESIFENSKLSEFERKIAIKFYICECFGFAIDWFTNGMEEDNEARIETFCEFNKKIFKQFLYET